MTETVTLEHLKAAYTATFSSPGGGLVLRDLSTFCKEGETTFVLTDRDQTLIHEGRRQVFLRIRDFFGLSVEELTALRAGRYSRQKDDDDA